MGRIFYIIGKSSTGKDSVMRALLRDRKLGLREIIQYTTRPIRDTEEEGREYHFIDEDTYRAFEKAGRIVEMRAYNTVHGLWRYMMADDGTVDLASGNYVAVGTVESYVKVRDYFGADNVVPICLYVETGERLRRALLRERKLAAPKYAELCRRFLADEQDFDEAHLEAAGLLSDGKPVNGIENRQFRACVRAVKELITGVSKPAE